MNIQIENNRINVDLIQYAGMYFVYSIYRNGEIVYIGSSKNIYKRFKEHKYQKDFEFIELIRCSDMREALTVEREMIFKHQPQENIFCKNNLRKPDLSNFKYGIKELIKIHRSILKR